MQDAVIGASKEGYKACRVCSESKHPEKFVKNCKSPDGRATVCKSCDAERARKWRLNNLEKSRELAKASYYRDPKRANQRSKAWYAANTDRAKAIKAKYVENNRNLVAERLKDWRARNPDRVLGYAESAKQRRADAKAAATAYDVPLPADVALLLRKARRDAYQREWVESNRERVRGYGRAYKDRDPDTYRHRDRLKKARARALNTVKYKLVMRGARFARRWRKPDWVSWGELYAIRAEAKRRTEETGVRHEIDHIYPLQSPYVCGLDVPANMRVVPREVNRQKHNKISSLCLHEFAEVPTHLVYQEEQSV